MKMQEIMNAVEAIVTRCSYTGFTTPPTEKQKYGCWTVGITNDPGTRKTQHADDGKNVKSWKEWKADGEPDARSIEKYFIEKGMKGGTGGGNPQDKPDRVYIF